MFKNYWPYMLVFAGLFGALWYFNSQKKPGIQWNKTYKESDKIPFGSNAITRLMEENFFNGKLKSKNVPLLQNVSMKTAQGVSYFFLTDRLFFDQYENKKIFDFAARGNTLFFCANYFHGSLGDTLHLETESEVPNIDAIKGKRDTTIFNRYRLNFVNPSLKNEKPYVYDDLMNFSWFSGFDSTRMSVLAMNDSGKAIMLRTKVGKGELIFLSVPDVFANYYLVNHPSRAFAYKALSTLNNREIWWDEYYKTANPKNVGAFRFMVYNDALYTAFWLTVISVLFFMFWGMKRVQRPVPVIKPPANTTLEFVEVVGNVYFSAKNHKIIAVEKIMFFLEFIRTKFQVKTELITEEDVTRISKLSGLPLNKVQELFANISYIYNVEHLSESELLKFNHRMEEFYKYNNR